MRELRRNFHPPTQLYRLLLKGFLKWIITVSLSAAMGGIMYYYSTYVMPMSESDKQKYNFLVIGLSLALGINLASSLKAMATDIRWWILSLKRRKLREVDLILHLDSLTEVFKLAFIAPKLAPACISWLFLNIVRYTPPSRQLPSEKNCLAFQSFSMLIIILLHCTFLVLPFDRRILSYIVVSINDTDMP
jgi:hypothetical protein